MARIVLLLRYCRSKCSCSWFQQRIAGAKKWLKPSFNTSEPLNYLAILLAGFWGFAIPYPAHAFEDDGSWRSGYYWTTYNRISVANNNYLVGPTSSQACSVVQQYKPQATTSLVEYNGKFFCGDYGYRVIQRLCTPSGYIGEHGCGEEPEVPNNCPAAGEKYRLSYIINGHYDKDGNFIKTPKSEQPPVVDSGRNGSRVSDTGCSYRDATLDEQQNGFDRDHKCKVMADGSIHCWQNYISNGEVAPPQENTLPLIQNSPPEDQGVSDTRKDSETTVSPPPNTVTSPDGTKLTTNQVTTTETRGDGVKVTTQRDVTQVTESDGIIKEKITTTITHERPDGTKTVTTEEHTTYTQTDITNYTINNEGDRITINNTEGSTASSTTNTVVNYDANGHRTGSTSTTTGSGTGTGNGNGSGDADCSQNPNAEGCGGDKEYDGAPEGGEYTPGDKTFETVLTGFNDRIKQTPPVTALSGFFNLNVSGSCTPITESIWIFTIRFDQPCSSTVRNILPIIEAIIIATACFVGFRIAFL